MKTTSLQSNLLKKINMCAFHVETQGKTQRKLQIFIRRAMFAENHAILKHCFYRLRDST